MKKEYLYPLLILTNPIIKWIIKGIGQYKVQLTLWRKRRRIQSL